MKAKTYAETLALARKARKLTQEEVAFSVGLSNHATLSDFERGKTVPSLVTADKLYVFYDRDIRLREKYLSENSDMGHDLVKDFGIGDDALDNLAALTLDFQKEHEDIEDIRRQLTSIARDNNIEDHERKAWNVSMNEVHELVRAGIKLLLGTKKSPSQDGNLVGAVNSKN